MIIEPPSFRRERHRMGPFEMELYNLFIMTSMLTFGSSFTAEYLHLKLYKSKISGTLMIFIIAKPSNPYVTLKSQSCFISRELHFHCIFNANGSLEKPKRGQIRITIIIGNVFRMRFDCCIIVIILAELLKRFTLLRI